MTSPRLQRATTAALALLLCASTAAVTGPSAPVGASSPPMHSVVVQTAGATMFPAFDPAIERFAVRAGADSPATMTVRATSEDPSASVRVNGRLAASGTATVTGLAPGDEVSVFITDSAGTATYSLVHLPTDFPVLERTTPAAATEEGLVLLTLGKWIQASPFFETAVDNNGVPGVLRVRPHAMDFKLQPNGNFSTSVGGLFNSELVEYDSAWNEVKRHTTRGRVNTDGHDSILLNDGSAYLMAYEPNAESGLTDAIIQHVDKDGTVLFDWNSKDHVDVAAEQVGRTDKDYAHINSFEIMDDGDILASFRHLSSIFKIARTSREGVKEGDVVWKLGGRASDFTFTDMDGAPDGGPCAQHTASQLPNGNILAFDNGSWNIDNYCVDPTNPSGPSRDRVPTRIAEWSLDEVAGEATLVRDVQINGRYAIFAGSTQPLSGGNTMVGWASSTEAVASELDPDGDVVWELVAPEASKYFTYRAFRAVVPDALAPTVDVEVAQAGAAYSLGERVGDWFECTDLGGSSLQRCDATAPDTSTPGSRTMTVRAVDGAGNVTVVSRPYTVAGPAEPGPAQPPAPTTAVQPQPQPPVEIVRQPDLHVRAVRADAWRGQDAYAPARRQVLRRTATARSEVLVRIQNDGEIATRFRLKVTSTGTLSSPGWRRGQRLTPLLAPGESWRFRVAVRQPELPAPAKVVVVARDGEDPEVSDQVLVRWR